MFILCILFCIIQRKNKRLVQQSARQQHITLENKKMNYLQLDNVKGTVLKYSPLKSAVTLKPGLVVIQGHWIYDTIR